MKAFKSRVDFVSRALPALSLFPGVSIAIFLVLVMMVPIYIAVTTGSVVTGALFCVNHLCSYVFPG